MYMMCKNHILYSPMVIFINASTSLISAKKHPEWGKVFTCNTDARRTPFSQDIPEYPQLVLRWVKKIS